MNLPQHTRPLLQPEHDVLLYERKLHPRRQRLELLELRVRLGQQALLVLLAPQRQQRAGLVAAHEQVLRHRRLLGRQGRYAALVLMKLVALGLEIEDSSKGALDGR